MLAAGCSRRRRLCSADTAAECFKKDKNTLNEIEKEKKPKAN